MRALRFHRLGPPEVLQVDDVEPPTVGAGEALIDVWAAGLNFADTERRRGLYLSSGPLPVTSGFEGAGVVRRCPDAPEWEGTRVAFLSAGAAAEVCVAPIARLIPLPERVSFVHGAAFPLQGLTAWHVVHTAGRVAPGETVCVSAAAGGVGLLAVQLARQAGARVVGLVSTEAKRAPVMERGAHDVVVGAAAAGLDGSVDVFLDSVGREVAELGLRLLRPFGRWVHFGEASGPSPAIAPARLLEKSISLHGWWLRTPHPEAVWRRGVEAVVRAVEAGTLRLDVTTCSLEDAAWAHAELEGRRTTGKVVLLVRPQ